MKKCPKCGTVLDDSKKKCYMCGADLTKPVAKVDNTSQNKAMGNSVNSPANANAEVVVNKGAGYNAAMNVNIYSSNELNSMNSMQYDERSKLEKIFAGQSELKSKDEINAIKSNEENNDKKGSKKASKKKVTKGTKSEKQSSKQLGNQGPNNANGTAINWENNLADASNGKNISYKEKSLKKNNTRLIFNIVCTILFVGCIIFAVVLLINKNNDGEGLFKKNKNAELFGGLSYKIDNSFILKTQESNRRHYTMGDNCSISISYGPTSDKEGFIDNYFENIKASYEKQEGFTTQKTELTIQGNQWSEMSIIELRKTGESDISYATYTRYKYISIVNNGNFYTIMFANTDDNAECSAKYDKMVDSLNFE